MHGEGCLVQRSSLVHPLGKNHVHPRVSICLCVEVPSRVTHVPSDAFHFVYTLSDGIFADINSDMFFFPLMISRYPPWFGTASP